jgi:hypothetical protein
LLVPVRQGRWLSVNPQDPLVQPGDYVHKRHLHAQARRGPDNAHFAKAGNNDLLGLVHNINGLAQDNQTNYCQHSYYN